MSGNSVAGVSTRPQSAGSSRRARTNPGGELLHRLNGELADLASEVHASLVRVETDGRHGSRRAPTWGSDPPSAAGAGTIWHPDGLILTNAHVVWGRRLHVVLADRRRLPARLLACDRELDLAALSVEADGLPTIALGDSRLLQPGNWVVAFGHPWGVEGAATAGVVIGQGRTLPERPGFGREWLAVSTHYRPGHSGGPLVDAEGRLVGINTVMAGPDVGLAVPIHVIKSFLKDRLGRGGSQGEARSLRSQML